MKKTHIDYPINDDTLYRLADLFKVFGDPTRIRILYVLSVEELCVQDIADRLSMTQSAISHQLRVLKQMSLVKFRRDGKTRQPCGKHHESGSGTRYRRITHKTQCKSQSAS